MLYLQALLLRPAVPAGAFLLCLKAPFCCTWRRLWARPRRPRIYPRKRKQNGRSTAPPNPPDLSGPPVGGPRPGPSRPAEHRPDPEMAATAGPSRIRTPGPVRPESPPACIRGHDGTKSKYAALILIWRLLRLRIRARRGSMARGSMARGSMARGSMAQMNPTW